MTDNHPITVPAGSITGWKLLYCNYQGDLSETEYIVLKSAQLGADQELEACCEWLVRNYNYPEAGNPLRTARRPKPPSLNSIALQMLGTIERDAHYIPEITDTIRRALEALPND
jgi:hypothetical protein